MEWLKRILGAGYSEEAAKKAAAEIGRRFVSREDFNALNETKKRMELESTAQREQLARMEALEKELKETAEKCCTLAQERETESAAYKETLREMQLTHALENAGAKNIKAARALLEDFLEIAEAADGKISGLDEEILRLREDTNSSFLFESAVPAIAGAAPAQAVSSAPDPERSSLEAQLEQARHDMDTLAAIRIKQEAAREGIVLI